MPVLFCAGRRPTLLPANVFMTKRPSSNCLAIMLAAAILSPALWAQTAAARSSDSPVALPSFEVVGTPVAGLPAVDDYAEATTTVSSTQLSDLNALDFASALRRTPGVTISRYNQVGAFGGDAGGAVFVRGLGVSRPGGEIKTLVDGVPKLNGIFNHPLLDLMSIDLAARIDVHARATPLEFGNTFAAINIITPRVEQPGTIARTDVAAGSFGTAVERLDVGAKEGAFDYYFNQSYRRSDGARPDSNGRMENYFLRLGWTLSPAWNLSYELNRTHNNATDPGGEVPSPGVASTRGETYATADWLHIAALTWHYTRADGSIRAYLNDGEGNWIRRPFSGNADSLNDWRLSGVRWRETLHLGEGGEILTGADLDYDRGTSTSVPLVGAPAVFGPATLRLFSPYAGMSHTLTLDDGARLTPSLGARFYDHSQFGSLWAPQAGVTLVSGATQWHAGASRAVNFPGLEVEAFSQIIIPALGQSWQALKPEKANQYELGVRHTLAPGTDVAVTAFRNDARDRYLIELPPPPPPRFVNFASYRTEGVEVTAETAPTKEIAVFAGVSLLRTTPGDVPYAPKSTLTGGLNWRLAPGWFASVDGSYASAMHVLTEARFSSAANPNIVGAHFLLNARLARRFAWGPAGAHRAEAYLAGENLTDRRFAYQPGYPIPGINGMLGLRLEW
jgi:iron complex outermembrane receptor protein